MLIGFILVAVGVLLAFAGRRLIWLLVGAVGFLAGYSLVGRFLPGADTLVHLAVGLALGLLFGFLARAFAKFVLAAAGFILVGGLALTLASYFGISGGFSGLLVFIIGGLIGIGLVSFAFDLSLVLLSVLGGVALIIQGAPDIIGTGHQELVMLAGVTVGVLGFLAQWRGWRKR
jgi:hypothetical protein